MNNTIGKLHTIENIRERMAHQSGWYASNNAKVASGIILVDVQDSITTGMRRVSNLLFGHTLATPKEIRDTITQHAKNGWEISFVTLKDRTAIQSQLTDSIDFLLHRPYAEGIWVNYRVIVCNTLESLYAVDADDALRSKLYVDDNWNADTSEIHVSINGAA